MPLIQNRYGKGRVRVMRVHRDGAHNEVRELSVKVLLDGDFSAAYTAGDNRQVVATDTIKNIVYIVARENLQANNELYGQALAARFLDRYPQIVATHITLHETRWTRTHEHAFLLDANGKPTAQITATRAGTEIVSGIEGFTFMKSTQSGWEDFVFDEYTTLPPTNDRIAATAMDASWTWLSAPADYEATNRTLLHTTLEVFATTYSKGVQDSLFRMGEAALAAIPELGTIRMACPNKHYIPMNLGPFGMNADNGVFIATDEPHGQIECVVCR